MKKVGKLFLGLIIGATVLLSSCSEATEKPLILKFLVFFFDSF